MSNRVFNLMGLNGKAVLPMVLGLGCGTMAVMTSRILETKKRAADNNISPCACRALLCTAWSYTWNARGVIF